MSRSPPRTTPPSAGPVDSYECIGGGVYLYEDINYGGACRKWTADDPELGDDGWHDRASSLSVIWSAGWQYRVTLYEHAGYTGASTTFSIGNDPWLGDDAIGNDSVDSIRIQPAPFCDPVSEIPEGECEALVALYNSTFGPYWTNRAGWLATYTPCTWYGITCSGGHVTRVQLGNNHLSGSLPMILGNLTSLQILALNDNLLTGSLPATLGDLSGLQYLNLQVNQLTGSIPTTLGKLGQLRALAIHQNQLSARSLIVWAT